MHWPTVSLPRRASSGVHWLRPLVVVLAALLVLAGCGSTGTSANALDAAQYAWSGAIRWGDFGGARNLVDPAVREAHPLTQLEMERYEQVQISSYREMGGVADPKSGQAVRNIEIGVINRHTMAERTVRYVEQWRWDGDAKAWWLVSDLPDLWAGQ